MQVIVSDNPVRPPRVAAGDSEHQSIGNAEAKRTNPKEQKAKEGFLWVRHDAGKVVPAPAATNKVTPTIHPRDDIDVPHEQNVGKRRDEHPNAKVGRPVVENDVFGGTRGMVWSSVPS